MRRDFAQYAQPIEYVQGAALVTLGKARSPSVR